MNKGSKEVKPFEEARLWRGGKERGRVVVLAAAAAEARNW